MTMVAHVLLLFGQTCTLSAVVAGILIGKTFDDGLDARVKLK